MNAIIYSVQIYKSTNKKIEPTLKDGHQFQQRMYITHQYIMAL